jgi:hypothetical protein
LTVLIFPENDTPAKEREIAVNVIYAPKSRSPDTLSTKLRRI